MSWLHIDWDQPRPSTDDVSAAWAKARIGDVSTTMPADVETYLNRLRELYANGNVIALNCRLSYDPCLAWFASRNRIDECGLLDHAIELLSRSGLHPELFETRSRVLPTELSPLVLGGYLAWTLVDGGAYQNMSEDQATAKHLGEAAARAVLQDRYADFLVYRSHHAWSSWFHDINWDCTWFLIDKAERRLTTICATDTD